MATYTKTVWNTGDLITADKMNKVETQLETVTPGATGAVRSDTSQSLNDTEKATARTNIAAASTADITTLTNNLNSAETSIAPAFSTSTDYTVGDLVIYNNKLYRFITAHAAGAWNINQVEEVNIADQLEKKANTDGYYEGLNVGSADQLNSTIYVEDNQPYAFRTSGGDVDIGDRVEDMLVGGTIAWNQFVPALNSSEFEFESGVTGTWNSDGSVTMSTSGNNLGIMTKTNNQINIISNHKYLFHFDAKGDNGLIVRMLTGSNLAFQKAVQNDSWVSCSTITKKDTNGNGRTYVFGLSSTGYTSLSVKNIQVHDLTQMFGEQIADYIYDLETANAGDGVAFFRKLFPKPYYAYNAGELISVAAAKKIATGFNQFNGILEQGSINNSGADATSTNRVRTQFIKVLPNTKYYMRIPDSTPVEQVVYEVDTYNADKTWKAYYSINAKHTLFTTGSDVGYIKILLRFSDNRNTTPSDWADMLCVNLSWSGYRDGEYEPYHQSITEFDPNLELRGIVKLDANNKLYYDGDTYESDGTVTRKYGIIDLGTLNWSYRSEVTSGLFSATISNSKISTNIGAICLKYEYYGEVAGVNDAHAKDKTFSMYAYGGYVYVYDTAYNNASTFKTAMSGIYLVYELATPTTEAAASFTKTLWVDDFGTEQFYDSKVLAGSRDVSMPVGHESKYLANLRDKLQHLPESTGEDGDYYIRQKSKQMELVNFANGYNHPNGVVGTAQQLESTLYGEDKVPYVYRTSGGSADIGNRVDEEIVGGTVAWNQMIQATNTNDWGFETSVTGVKDGDIVTISSTVANNGAVLYPERQFISGHVVFLSYDAKGTSGDRARLTATNVSGLAIYANLTGDVWKTFSGIRKISETTVTRVYVIGGDSTYTNMSFRHPQMFDLTQMFGSTIADYVYSLEQATVGAGVAWFKSLFPKDYYAYNPGELMSVNAARKETVGFNQWDEEWLNGYYANDGTFTASAENVASKNRIPVVPSTTYYFHGAARYSSGVKVLFYDASNAYISYEALYVGSTFTTPAGCTNILFYTYAVTGINSYANDICINFSWSGTRNGEYEPYQKLSHELGDVELRGIPKLDANNKLYYDGDTYSSNGKIIRKYDYAELKDLEWTTQSASSVQYFVARPNSTIQKNADLLDIIVNCNIYLIDTTGASLPEDGYIKINTNYWGNGQKLTIRDSSISTVNQLKAKIEGAIVSNLATPTEEASTPYANPSPVDDWGTEEFIDRAVEAEEREVSVPVGHNSKYMANLRDKLQHLPSLADSDGLYIVNQVANEMELISFPSPIKISGITPYVYQGTARAELLFNESYKFNGIAYINIKIKSLITNTSTPTMVTNLPLPRGGDAVLNCIEVDAALQSIINFAIPAGTTGYNIYLKSATENKIYNITGCYPCN